MRFVRLPMGLALLLLLVVQHVPVTAQSLQPTAGPFGAGPAGGSPFFGDGEPPDGVRALLEWSGGGAGISGTSCTFRSDGVLVMPSTSPDGPPEVPCSVAVNDNVMFWVESGGRSTALEQIEPSGVQVRRPDGSRLDQIPDEDGDRIVWIGLGSPLGPYTVSARHGDREFSGQFAVTLRDTDPEQPYPIMRLWPRRGPPGTQFRATLAGFQPSQDVSLYLYLGTRGDNPTYLATLGQVRVDGRGEAVYAFQTRSTDPEGQYLLASQPESVAADLRGASLVLSTRDDDAGLRGSRNFYWAEDRETLERVVRAFLLEANRTWASVVAKDGRPADLLGCVYDRELLADAKASEQGRRSRGEYRVARMLGPLDLHDLQLINSRVIDGRGVADGVMVTVVESWDDRTFDVGGRLIRDSSGRAAFRYQLRHEHSDYRVWDGLQSTYHCRSHGWWITNVESLGRR